MMQLSIQESKIEQFFNHSKDDIIRALKFIVDNDITNRRKKTRLNSENFKLLSPKVSLIEDRTISLFFNYSVISTDKHQR